MNMGRNEKSRKYSWQGGENSTRQVPTAVVRIGGTGLSDGSRTGAEPAVTAPGAHFFGGDSPALLLPSAFSPVAAGGASLAGASWGLRYCTMTEILRLEGDSGSSG